MIGKREMLKERVELLGLGEAMGFPRLGYGNKAGKKLSIPAGDREWERFCHHGHTLRIIPALRVAKVLSENGIAKFHPMSSREVDRVAAEYRAFLGNGATDLD